MRCGDPEDVVVRYRGEEFLVMFPGKDLDTAALQAEKIKNEVEQEGLNTVSIAVAHSNVYKDFDAVVSAADIAMNRAKRDGRNRMFVDKPHLERFLS